MTMKRRIVTLVFSLTAALGLMAAPASAQTLVGGGLVNVGVGDVDVTVGDVEVLNDLIQVGDITLEDVADLQATVQVPIGIAANVCPGVNAAVLAQSLGQDATAECVADAQSAADSRQFQNFTNRGGGNGNA